MRLGVSLPTVSPAPDAESVLEVASAADRLGLHSVWTSDHVVFPATRESRYPYERSTTDLAFSPGVMWLDPVAVMGFVASATERVAIGTSVLVLPYRNPLVLANQIASLDRLSDGRVVLGVGVGWMDEEFTALGMRRAERGARTDEYLRAMRALWSSSEPCSFDGRFVSFRDVTLATAPATPGGPPVWVGGNGEPAIRRALALGDGWIGFDIYPEELRGALEPLERLAGELDRDPADLTLTVRRGLVPPFDVTNFLPGRRSIGGSDSEVLDELSRYAEAGIELVALDLAMTIPEMVRTIEWLTSEIVPRMA